MSFLSRICLSLILLSLLISHSHAQDKAAQIERVVSAYHDMDLFHGTVLVAERGNVIYKNGFGLANREWNIPHTPDTRIRLGSITKQFTAMLILQLVDQGKIRLDAPVSTYIPDYPKPNGDRVTVHHLLTHGAGIPNFTSFPEWAAEINRDPFTTQAFMERFWDKPLNYEPGSKFSYSNSNYYVLGVIIERVTGMTYEEALQSLILTPLGMEATGFSHHHTIIPKRADGYVRLLGQVSNGPYLHTSTTYAAGAMYGTVEDLFLWDRALYTDRLIPADLRDLMLTPHQGDYGYGFFITKQSTGAPGDSVRVVYHTGGTTGGWITRFSRLIDDQHTIIILDNTQGRHLWRIQQAVINILYDQPYDMPKQPVLQKLYGPIAEGDVDGALKIYRDLEAGSKDAYDWPGENGINNLGYQLLFADRLEEAVTVFRLNAALFSESFNVHDSLGEAYMSQGSKELAIEAYERSVELNPEHTDGKEMLRKLRKE